MDITNVLEPGMLWLILPMLLLLAFFVFKDFVNDDFRDKKEKRNFRILFFIIRILILALIVVALAKPYGEVTTTTPGDPKITILVDRSNSMELLDTQFFEGLTSQLEEEFPVSIKEIGSPSKSAIGEEILGYLEKDTNLLLLTDGRSNSGPGMKEISLLAANLNSTISALKLEPLHAEASVSILGPDTAVAGVNNTYAIKVASLKNSQVGLKVTVDGTEVINQPRAPEEQSFQYTFTEGEHQVVAEVTAADDYFSQNNKFYKVVSSVKKPKILLVQNTQDPVEQIFNQLYDVTKSSSIPENVNDYYAVVINDMPANIQGVERLADYLIDKDGGYYGNGLFVMGGFDSYDRGNYKGSILESFLPVTVGKAARQRGSSNIVIAIDLSGTTGKVYNVRRDPESGKVLGLVEEQSNVADVNKALATSIINSLGPDNSVGVSIFSTQSATVSELAPLFQTKATLLDKIARIVPPGGQSYFNLGLSGAYLLLKDNVGSNNIIIITDGRTGNDEIRRTTIDTAKTLNARGVKVYTVGTGRNVDENFLKDIAYNGGGIFFPATQANNLKILFGEPSDSKFGEVFDLFMINPFHFITQGITLDANLYGYNQVVPRPSSIMLVTTQRGEPALTVWNFGFGRVASLNVFSGNNNLGDLLNPRNSILLSRTTNWVIGDPQRKEDYYVVIEDARLNSSLDVVVKSTKYPNAEGLTLSKVGENQYKATIVPEELGVQSIMGKSYAVNYEQEYEEIGFDEELATVLGANGGRVFEPSQREEIIEFVKSVSKRTRTEKTTIVWPFLVAAAVLFIIEVMIRRIRDNRANK